MSLRKEIRRLAVKASAPTFASREEMARSVESAILEGVRLVLEREPSEAMILSSAGFWTPWEASRETPIEIYRAMTQELIKELTEEDRNAETKRSTA